MVRNCFAMYCQPIHMFLALTSFTGNGYAHQGNELLNDGVGRWGPGRLRSRYARPAFAPAVYGVGRWGPGRLRSRYARPASAPANDGVGRWGPGRLRSRYARPAFAPANDGVGRQVRWGP